MNVPESPLGLTPMAVAQELRQKLHSLSGGAGKPWDGLAADTRTRWVDATGGLFIKCQRGVVMSARAATEAFSDGILGHGKFATLPPSMQLLWEAILRHGINLITAGQPLEGRESRSDLERELVDARDFNWSEWLKAKAQATNEELAK